MIRSWLMFIDVSIVWQGVSLFLLARLETPLPDGYWARTALNKRYWVVFQILAIAFTATCTFILDSNPIMRYFVSNLALKLSSP